MRNSCITDKFSVRYYTEFIQHWPWCSGNFFYVFFHYVFYQVVHVQSAGMVQPVWKMVRVRTVSAVKIMLDLYVSEVR